MRVPDSIMAEAFARGESLLGTLNWDLASEQWTIRESRIPVVIELYRKLSRYHTEMVYPVGEGLYAKFTEESTGYPESVVACIKADLEAPGFRRVPPPESRGNVTLAGHCAHYSASLMSKVVDRWGWVPSSPCIWFGRSGPVMFQATDRQWAALVERCRASKWGLTPRTREWCQNWEEEWKRQRAYRRYLERSARTEEELEADRRRRREVRARRLASAPIDDVVVVSGQASLLGVMA